MDLWSAAGLLGALGVLVWFLTKYFSYKWGGNSFKHVAIIIAISYVGALIGNSILSNGTLLGIQVVPDMLMGWATHDALQDGQMGNATYLFFAVIIGFAIFAMFLWHKALQKAGSKLQNPKAFVGVKILTTILMIYPSILLGINLDANAIRLDRANGRLLASVFSGVVAGVKAGAVEFIDSVKEDLNASEPASAINTDPQSNP